MPYRAAEWRVIMVKGIEHVAIFAKDTKALCDWYVNMFDLKVVYDNGKGTYFAAFESGDMIEFCMQTESGSDFGDKTGGIRHLALSVTEDGFDKMVEKLKNAGVEIVSDVSVSSKGIKTFFFRDIESNISHLIYRPQPLV